VALLFGAWGIAAEWFRYALPDGQRWAPDLIVGLSWLGFAWVVTTRTAALRSGLLMLAYSGTWFIGNFAALERGFLAGLAAQGTYLHRGVLVHLLLTFPRGRFEGRFLAVLVAVSYGVSLVPALARSAPITIVLACLVTGAAGWRVRESFGRARAPRVAALVAAGLLTTSLVVLARVRLTGAADDRVLLLAYQVVLVAVGAVLTVAAVRLGRRGDEVAGLVIDLMDGPPAAMAQALARALGDPSITVGYWAPARQSFLDAAGLEFSMVAATGRAVSVVQSGEGPLLALDHDKATTLPLDASGPLEQAAALMVANARLHTQLRDRARELEAARRRLVDSEALERRRLEQQLRAGAGRRLEALRRTLSAAEQVSTPAVVSELVVAIGQVDRSAADLRRLSRGLYPSTLTADGLPAALRELADHAPVTVQTVTEGEVPGHLRELVYFVCAEALANVVKHARAESARVSVVRRDSLLRVEVTDDGVGPPPGEPGSGSGLRGLSDRVAAYGGGLEVTWPPSGGTRLTAEVPLDGQSRSHHGAAALTPPSPTGGSWPAGRSGPAARRAHPHVPSK
jgi:signal transduction histidine kinase